MDWSSSPPKSASYVFPYVVTWSQVTGNIHVYNLLDQKCVQQISFQVSGHDSEFCNKSNSNIVLEWSISQRLLWKALWCARQIHLHTTTSPSEGAGACASDFVLIF